MADSTLLYYHTDGTLDKIEGRGVYVIPESALNGFPADENTEVRFGYSFEAGSPPNEITFTINGQEHTVPVEEHPDHPGFHVAEDTLTTSHAGEVLIEAEGESITIEATEPNS